MNYVKPTHGTTNMYRVYGCRCGVCVAATRAYARKYQAQPKSRKYARKNQKERAMRLKMYKLSLGCARCGYNVNPSALDFHHVGSGKVATVGSLTNCSWGRIMDEVSLCILLCSNCHREETHPWETA